MAELETGSFDAVIDKGLTDSIMYNDNFALMMAKVSRERFFLAARFHIARQKLDERTAIFLAACVPYLSSITVGLSTGF